ncbi:MAG: M23 family metallopeptidase [Deltaproteobacteria bacterium]|nr:MAG: M23 family metallopeptidase [Deltaproteobacteria bacterium]
MLQHYRFWRQNSGIWVLAAMAGLLVVVGGRTSSKCVAAPAVRAKPASPRQVGASAKPRKRPVPGRTKPDKTKPKARLPVGRSTKTATPTWKHILQTFVRLRQTKKAEPKTEAAKKALLQQEITRWKRFLSRLKAHLPKMSQAMLVRTRKVLEIEGDRDRNRFASFPSDLSMTIIKTMVAIDLTRGAYKKPKPQPRTQTQRSNRYMMGETGHSPQYWLTKTKPPVDESKLPPLVFRQKDLERFKVSRTLISWPMARRRVGSGFGWRRDPFTRKLRFHNGIDIGAPYGTPVWAAAGGYVWRTGWLGSCGLGVLIRHRKGMMTYYCHLSQILAPVGKWVKRREVIGKIGSTGRSTSPHLHFSLVLKGKPVNPLSYLP